MSKTDLRKTLRAKRLSLSTNLITLYSQKITATLLALPAYHHAQHVGCYFPMQNEADLHRLIQQAWHMQKNIYLPVLDNANAMDFYAYTPTTELIKNKYGIDEPNIAISSKIHPTELDLLLIPLVAFDPRKNRLGQGFGFYDRYLTRYKETEKKTITIGIGYECQKVDHIPIDAWDIALDFIVSEKQIY